MTASSEDGGSLRITLRDVWMAQQATKTSIDTLNNTMLQLTTHLESIDKRNAQADDVHRATDQRVTRLEQSSLVYDPKRMRDDLDVLIKAQVSEEAISKARRRGTAALWAGLAALAAAIAAVAGLLTFITTHA